MINNSYHLVISGMMGTPYVAKLLKGPMPVMSSDRIQIPETEFLQAVEHYAKARIKEGHDALEIKNQDDKVVMTITIAK